MSTIPHTRDQAVALLQKLGWDDDELSPEERAAVRALYRLDDKEVPLPQGARYIGAPLKDPGVDARE